MAKSWTFTLKVLFLKGFIRRKRELSFREVYILLICLPDLAVNIEWKIW